MFNNLLLLATGSSAAAAFLAANGPFGAVLDFPDASIAIDDAADLLDFTSQGQVSGGSLVGPGARLTYSAPSPKLTEQSDGVLRFQAHNLCLWSNDFSNAAWNKLSVTVSTASSPPVSATAFSLQSTGSGARVLQSVALFGNSAFGIWARRVSGSGSVSIGWDLSTPTVISLTSSWQFFEIESNLASATYTPRITFASSGDIIEVCAPRIRRTPSQPDYIATTSAAAYDLPYVWSGGVRQGIVVEPQATNLYLGNLNPITRNITVSAGAHTLSFRGTGSVTLSGAATGTLVGTGANDRVSLTFTATAGTLTVTPSAPVTLVQVETGTVATSGIITYDAAVTRAIDNVSLLTNAMPFNPAEGALFAEFSAVSPAVLGYAVAINNGTTSNLIGLRTLTTANLLVNAGNVAQAITNNGTVNAGQTYKFSGVYRVDDFAASINGSAAVTDVSGSIPSVTSLYVGSAQGSVAALNGLIRRVAYFPRRLSNAELQAITA